MRVQELDGDVALELGDHCTIDFAVGGEPPALTLSIESGLDAGTTLRAGRPEQLLALEDLGIPACIYFRDGRPILQHPGTQVVLSGNRIAQGDVQLIHGDTVSVEGIDIEVL